MNRYYRRQHYRLLFLATISILLDIKPLSAQMIPVDNKPPPSANPKIRQRSKNKKPSVKPPPLNGEILIEKFIELTGSFEKLHLHSDKPVTLTYTEPKTKTETLLTAPNLDIDNVKGVIASAGLNHDDIVMTRPEGVFKSRSLTFNYRTYAGEIKDASVNSQFFRMSGERIQALEGGKIQVDNGEFTTCINTGNPDYHFKAKSITIQPNDYVSAKNVKLYLGKFAFPTIPSLRRGLNSENSFPIPFPGYSKQDGITLRLQANPIDEKDKNLSFDFRVNFRELPNGFVIYQQDLRQSNSFARSTRTLLPALSAPLRGILEQINPPTYRDFSESYYSSFPEPRSIFYVALQNEQNVVNSNRTDLQISRYPEVGIQLFNLLGHARKLDQQRDISTDIAFGQAARQRLINAPFLLNIDGSASEITENPTKVTAGRLSLRGVAASQPFRIGRNISLRAGISESINLYSKGTSYSLFIPEIELDLSPTRTSSFNIGYRNLTDSGKTPFVFDRRDLRNELRLRYQVSGLWGFGVTSRIDLDHSRGYDNEFVVVRNYDCMQAGVSYRTRSQSINLIFSILPPNRNRKERAQMPLPKSMP